MRKIAAAIVGFVLGFAVTWMLSGCSAERHEWIGVPVEFTSRTCSYTDSMNRFSCVIDGVYYDCISTRTRYACAVRVGAPR